MAMGIALHLCNSRGVFVNVRFQENKGVVSIVGFGSFRLIYFGLKMILATDRYREYIVDH